MQMPMMVERLRGGGGRRDGRGRRHAGACVPARRCSGHGRSPVQLGGRGAATAIIREILRLYPPPPPRPTQPADRHADRRSVFEVGGRGRVHASIAFFKLQARRAPTAPAADIAGTQSPQ